MHDVDVNDQHTEVCELSERYAQLVVRAGLNVQPGQRLIVLAPIELAAFARHLAQAAYQAGARYVDVLYGDAQLVQARLTYAPRDSFEEYATWRSDALLVAAERGDGVISLVSPFLQEFSGGDQAALAAISRSVARHGAAYHQLRRDGHLQWCSVAAPNLTWAQRIFPSDRTEGALVKFWQLLLQAVRADQPQALRAWNDHVSMLVARCDQLNARRFVALLVTGPGTHLTLALPESHRWMTAVRRSLAGVPYAANLPTEEVFTLPHRDRVNGVVSLTRPFLLTGTPVVNARLHLQHGRVVHASAERGELQLRQLLRRDDGARRFGEVALVPCTAPLSRADVPFHAALLDENAGSHLALGRAYRSTLDGGEGMTGQEFRAAGGNESAIHVDMVFGSELTEVFGVTVEGALEPLMRHGQWCN